MPATIEQAERIRQSLIAEKEELERRRQEINARLAEIETLLGRPPRKKLRPGISQERFEELVSEILRRNQRPMWRWEIREAFRARRIHIGGTDSERNFGTKLWKAANLEGGPIFFSDQYGYCLEEWRQRR